MFYSKFKVLIEYPIYSSIFLSISSHTFSITKFGIIQIFFFATYLNISSNLQYGLSKISPITYLQLNYEQYRTAEAAPILLPHSINFLIPNCSFILDMTASIWYFYSWPSEIYYPSEFPHPKKSKQATSNPNFNAVYKEVYELSLFPMFPCK